MTRRLYQAAAVSGLALGLVFLLAGFAGWSGPDAAAPAPQAEWTPDLKSLDLSANALAPRTSFPETLVRPLFSATRRPPEARPPEPVAAPPQFNDTPPPPPVQVSSPGPLILKGIFISDERRLALIQAPSAPEGLWLAQGAEIEGWKVSRIDKQAIAIEANGQTADLTLYVDKPAN